MTDFEEVLQQFEPMISASIRTLNIYRDYEHFRQTGRIALWQAWQRFDPNKGNFTPYAYRSIRGAMLDELKKENHFSEQVIQMEDEILELTGGTDFIPKNGLSDELFTALLELSLPERQLLHWLFIDEFTQAECAARAGITVAGIKKRRERMLAKLRRKLENGRIG
ncbi:sigma-70 family RNA polymerase sigma factor [Sporosarcina sp. HYO08]|uniref:sigma-70 family RNA polymerase sigma factor n=1 Tax=Sporosarcina sp. HYO08 TaxID=1759557 RepID=UPI000798E07A|nr:sigma-70 family RNA polymerase sigma factor [Sporosarcina sp. HYO08]KXH86109.1 hypothetical protein AU377_14680 [Sporosarcina sp. HYO08]